jgi:UDP-N-acetyl-2-amino-2-deoxyglucuronate dehydrogenase
LTVDDAELEFSDGFTDLHTRSYEAILSGNGFCLEDNRVAIETVSGIRSMAITRGDYGEEHSFLRKVK